MASCPSKCYSAPMILLALLISTLILSLCHALSAAAAVLPYTSTPNDSLLALLYSTYTLPCQHQVLTLFCPVISLHHTFPIMSCHVLSCPSPSHRPCSALSNPILPYLILLDATPFQRPLKACSLPPSLPCLFSLFDAIEHCLSPLI